MKLLLTLGVCCFLFEISAQQTHIITLASNQPSLLTAHAGDDAVFSTSAQLGGAPSATGGTSPYTYAWSPTTDLSSAVAENPTLNNLTTERMYTLTVTYAHDCTASDEVQVTIAPLSVSGLSSIRMYPTVASHFLTIESATQISFVRILDLNGKEREHKQGDSPSLLLNVQSLKEGLYLLQVQTENEVATFKLIIQ